jgi:membrane protein implicated in regulation of membrane protease activity
MIVLGAILLILGYVFPAFHILWVIGVILLVVGAVMWVMGSMGRPVGGRRHYY